MKNKKYTNQTLAEDYFIVATKDCYSVQGIRNYNRIAKAIKQSDVDIYNFLMKNKSLDDLDIKGIGDETKEVLERMIKEGKKNVTFLGGNKSIDELADEITRDDPDGVYQE